MQRTAAPSSRIRKPGQRRSSASPFADAKLKKKANPARKKAAATAVEEDELDDAVAQLDDVGLVNSLAQDLRFSDVAQLLIYIRSHMFSPVPQEGAGMNSTQIAEVLNFRANLPPITSVSHVHAMTNNPTATEREIATLVSEGVVRRAVVPHRGSGGDALGDGLVLADEWELAVNAENSLSEDTKGKLRLWAIICCGVLALMHTAKYRQHLRSRLEAIDFTSEEVTTLVHTGFLVRSSSLSPSKADSFLQPGASTLGSLSGVAVAGSSFASGSAAAAGGSSLGHLSGGSAATQRLSSQPSKLGSNYAFSLPNTGPYLRLLTEAREHLLSLLGKANKFRELPKDLLKERWEGGIAGSDEASKAARARGEWKGVLPGRTRKWKQFYGLEFDWVLEECLGAGLVECFQTGSVGLGVRAI